MNESLDGPVTAPTEAATEHTRSRYNVVAPIYNLMEWPLEKAFFQYWRGELWAAVDGLKVLEIGVGTGKNVPYYPEDVHVTAIDLSPKMLARAREVAQSFPEKEITLREMDAQALDYPAATFDEVLPTFVFCSVPDPVQGLREALRVTRPGGHLYLLEHMRAMTTGLASLMDIIDGPFHWLTGVHIARETVDNVHRAGWSVQNVESLTRGDIVRRIVAQKPS